MGGEGGRPPPHPLTDLAVAAAAPARPGSGPWQPPCAQAAGSGRRSGQSQRHPAHPTSPGPWHGAGAQGVLLRCLCRCSAGWRCCGPPLRRRWGVAHLSLSPCPVPGFQLGAENTVVKGTDNPRGGGDRQTDHRNNCELAAVVSIKKRNLLAFKGETWPPGSPGRLPRGSGRVEHKRTQPSEGGG